ncbi:tyrosine-type recombinase/integrase [Methanobrevibacter arboriphilus]|uniref:tyrosine-type recombinase/integrase n=1 Tax=Methanobrevibacter arboriphilus TaxID=39441 RepID=UPI001C812735|nr:tyrosine-type recombinase/integrase [Methanobrevibacter arboriphilus]
MLSQNNLLHEIVNNDPKLKQLFTRRNVSKSRQKQYKTIFNEIYELNKKTPSELVKEAKSEEKPFMNKDNLPEIKDIDDRTITRYYYDYYNYLKSNELTESTIASKLGTFRAFYNEYNVELPKPVKLNTNSNVLREGDIPTIKDIRKAVNNATNIRNKAIILLMASSGIRSGDIRNFKISDFTKATSYYHNSDSIEDLLDSKYNNNIIPCWEFYPEKTLKQNNFCMTFNTPETSQAIIDYLKKRNSLQEDDYLFISQYKRQIGKHGIINIFNFMNDRFFYKTSEGKRFFHAHSLRKFFKSTAIEHTSDYKRVNIMTGHKLDNIEIAYEQIKENDMRRFYTNLVPYLSIKDTKVHDLKSKDYIRMKKLEEQVEAKDMKQKELEERLAVQEEQNKEIKDLMKKYAVTVERAREFEEREKYTDILFNDKHSSELYMYVIGKRDVDATNIDLLKRLVELTTTNDLKEMKKMSWKKKANEIIEEIKPYKNNSYY